jgi:hypothetical protein
VNRFSTKTRRLSQQYARWQAGRDDVWRGAASLMWYFLQRVRHLCHCVTGRWRAHQEVMSKARVFPSNIIDVTDSFEELPAKLLRLGDVLVLHLHQLFAGGVEPDAGRGGVGEGPVLWADVHNRERLVAVGLISAGVMIRAGRAILFGDGAC